MQYTSTNQLPTRVRKCALFFFLIAALAGAPLSAAAQDDGPMQMEQSGPPPNIDKDNGKDAKVVVSETKIEILDEVFFNTAKVTIKEKSFPILDQVAQVLEANPRFTKIRVECHTDNRGKREHNQKLSEGRAQTVVDYLAHKGIDPKRLVPVGYGPTIPIDSDESKEGRANNRRIEFTILELNGKTKPTDY